MFCRKISVICFIGCLLMSGYVFSAEGTDKEAFSDKAALLEKIRLFLDKKPEALKDIIDPIANYYIKENNIDEAISFYKEALKILPENEALLSRLGSLYTKKADYGNAVMMYEKLTAVKPENMQYIQMLSDAYRKAGEKEKLALMWQNIVNTSNKPDILMRAANFYTMEKNAEQALIAAKKAANIAPRPKDLQYLESLYISAGKLEEAEAICNDMLAQAKEARIKDWAASELVNIAQKQNKLSELAEKFQNELKNNPADILWYKQLANIYRILKDQEKLIEVRKNAIEAGFKDKDTYLQLLSSYETANRYNDAERLVRDMINTFPKETSLYERLAIILEKAGRQNDAKVMWEQFLSKAPNDAAAFSRFGDKLSEWNDINGAIAQYRKAQSLEPNNLWHSLHLSNMLIAKQKFGEAKKELEAILDKTKNTKNSIRRTVEEKLRQLESGTALKTGTKEKTLVNNQPQSAVGEGKQQPQKKKKGFFDFDIFTKSK